MLYSGAQLSAVYQFAVGKLAHKGHKIRLPVHSPTSLAWKAVKKGVLLL
jgi:hypothetical protein